jgi:aquaporin Z
VKKAILGEFLGTALMVAVGCGSVSLAWSHGAVSATFGLIVMTAILLFGSWSGAHINPAVTIAFWRDQQLDTEKVLPYIIAQCSGALLGSMLTQGAAPTTVAPSVSLLRGFVVEVCITAALMVSILLVVQRSGDRRVIAAWVGATVALLAWLAGPLTGASMNPARTFGPNVLNSLWATLPFYLVSTVIGAWLAVDIKRRWFPDSPAQL